VSSPAELVVYTDGASRDNPGQSGAGVAIEDAAGKPVAQAWRYLGEATNNQAEYEALCLGLELAASLGARRIAVRADSELIVRQMRGEYRVRHQGLRPLFARASGLAARFEAVSYEHVPRERNRVADHLANRAIDLRESGQSGPEDLGRGG
jgi:ribonuclease HI